MDRSIVKNQAKIAIKGKLWTIIAIFIVVYLAQAVLGYITFWAAGVASLLITGSTTLALAMIFLELLKEHQRLQIRDLLLGFKNGNFGRGLIGYLRYVVFSFLWGLLFIIPGVVKGFAYSQMFYLMADNPRLEPSEAQRHSIEMMNGHKMELLKLYLSFVPWLLLVIATLGIALIYVAPYFNATLAAYYNYLKKGEDNGDHS